MCFKGENLSVLQRVRPLVNLSVLQRVNPLVMIVLQLQNNDRWVHPSEENVNNMIHFNPY